MGDLLDRKRRSALSSSAAILLPLVLAFFLTLCTERSVVSSLEYSEDRPASNLTLEEIQEFLKTINKPAVVTFESNGDIIDCVDIYKQPAFDNPLLKNHQIQSNPTMMPTMEEVNGETNVSNSMNDERERMNEVYFQQWYQNLTRCPQGTVPIRRTTVDDVLRAGSISAFGKKMSNIFASTSFPNKGHEYAVAYTIPEVPVLGGAAYLNLWNPYVEINNEMSIGQIWIAAGKFESGDLNTIEAGWQVNPKLYGDTRTRLFSYWTSDGYKSTGCYNALCGFVQKDPTVRVGVEISPVSAFRSLQTEIYLTIYKDINTGNWWLRFGKSTMVGYWPGDLFTHLGSGGAEEVHWGGEILNRRPRWRHTSTQMGSGHFPSEGYKKAAYFRNLGIFVGDRVTQPVFVSSESDHPNCYDIRIAKNKNSKWGYYFYYGGPGRGNLECS